MTEEQAEPPDLAAEEAKGHPVALAVLCVLVLTVALFVHRLYANVSEMHDEKWGPTATWRENDYIQDHRYLPSRIVLAGHYLTVGLGIAQTRLERKKAKMLLAGICVAVVLTAAVFILSFFSMLIGPLMQNI